MSIFDQFFRNKAKPEESDPAINFGRFSDSYKQNKQYDAWDVALDKFKKEAYLESCKAFLDYLNDEREENVEYRLEDGKLRFELLQGSKIIYGEADRTKIRVEAKIAKANELNIAFMRRMVEQNFGLNYSRFGLDSENNITIVFDSFTLDASPYKLYYAIRELAINADKQDDILIDEFEELQPIENKYLIAITEEEKSVKYNFVTNEIIDVLEEIENGQLNANQYPGGIAYLLLDLCYKLDYLTKPEGFMMEALERMNRLFFAKDGQSTAQKNAILQKELEILGQRSKEEYFKEMYRVKTTFGITSPVNHERVCGLIDEVLHHMDWYKENGFEKIALAIAGYVVGNCLFNYAVPKPVKELFTLYYQIIETDYFRQLGFETVFYDSKTHRFDKKSIKNRIKEIVLKNKKRYPTVVPELAKLNYNNLADFAKSYLLMVKKMDLTRVE
jgi:hypothetical protein